jgi:hypothetical protein
MDPETREGIKRDVRLDIQNPAYPSQAAVEIAELIRASRLDAEALEPTEDDNSAMAEDSPSPFETAIPEIKEVSHDKPEPASPPSPQKADNRFRFHLDAGAGIAAGTFEQPPTAQIGIGAHWRFVDPAGVELIGRIPLASTRVEKSAGAADLTPWLVGLGVRLTFSNLLKRLHPAVGAGIGINILEIEGEAEPGFRPKSRTTATALLYLRIQGAIVLTKRLALVVGGTLGRSLPGIAVMIDDAPAVEWGHAVVHGYLGLEVGVI